MSPSAALARATRTRIGEHLAGKVQNSESFTDAYVRYQDIQQAWSGHETLQYALQASLSPKDVEIIENRLLRFLSILVYIRAEEFLNDFPGSFFDKGGNLLYEDSKLPLKDHQVPPLGSIVLRQHFFNDQFLFMPEPLFESSIIKHIDDQRRLPFEKISRNVFGGAYGQVDKMGISPFYFTTSNDNQNRQVKYVACKRFRSSNPSDLESKRELDNLKVLKESITSHGHIRTHMAILFHKGEHLILLPWADHFDLDYFLREGYPFLGEEPLYDFKLRFPQIEPATMINDICTQMYLIADALEWLHRGILGPNRNRVHFAHMDLKPNNILIDRDQKSAVGKWILTDFGISAFKENDEPASSDLVSIRDLYENLTIKTTPRRQPGAYQPPETEHMVQGSAGRRGDIWSFGCIFAEVLAFALGQRPAVAEFSKSRRRIHKNDYFYEKIPNQTLGTQSQRTSYRLRTEVDEWLRKLPERYVFPNRAIDCCTQTIRDILEVDGPKRIGAGALVKKMEHVAHHVNNARRPNSLLHCPLERSTLLSSDPPPLLDIPIALHHAPLQVNMARFPSIKRTTSRIEEEEILHDSGASVPKHIASKAPPHSPHPANPLHTQGHRPLVPLGTTRERPKPRQDSVQGQRTLISEHLESPKGLAITMKPGEPSDSSREDRSVGSHSSMARMSRADLHGITINQNRVREIRRPIESAMPGFPKSVVHSISLCPSGQYMAYLFTHPKDTHHIVNLCKVSLKDSSLQSSNTVQLPPGPKWTDIVQAGYNFVVWGNVRGGTKHVYIGSGTSVRAVWDSTMEPWLASLVTVAVSRHGSVALVGSKWICYVNLGDISNHQGIPPKKEHTFTDASFNDDGSLLYAWSFGRPDDCLHVWRIDEATRDLIQPTDSEGSYTSKQQGSSQAKIVPYNCYQGCIIHAPGNAFFPAQIRSTQRGNNITLPKLTTVIPDTTASCVFNDHSLVVVEKGFRHTRIREYRIAGGGNHVIEAAEKEPLIEWTFSAGKITQMRVVPVPDTDDLVIILCTLENKIIFIPIVARRIQQQVSGPIF